MSKTDQEYSEAVTACPNCDHSGVYRRHRHNMPDDEGVWRCKACGDTFDQPIERPARY